MSASSASNLIRYQVMLTAMLVLEGSYLETHTAVPILFGVLLLWTL